MKKFTSSWKCFDTLKTNTDDLCDPDVGSPQEKSMTDNTYSTEQTGRQHIVRNQFGAILSFAID